MNSQAQTQPRTTATDSIFGMALAQAFMGAAFGVGVEQAWETCEMADSVYTDRYAPKAKAQQPAFELGKKALSNVFGAIGHTMAELDRASFKPLMPTASFAPSFA